MSFRTKAPNYFGSILSTGFNDVDMFGSETDNTKANLAIHYRPNSNSEISLQSLMGTGTAPLSTGGTRYHMDNVEIQELFSILDKVPGARLIARLIASFDCPK